MGLNLQNFMKHSDMPLKMSTNREAGDVNLDLKSVGNVSDYHPVMSSHRPIREQIVLKQRAQSHEGHRGKFASTGSQPMNVVKEGLASFIKKSNIDIDELSNNLSQKRENSR